MPKSNALRSPLLTGFGTGVRPLAQLLGERCGVLPSADATLAARAPVAFGHCVTGTTAWNAATSRYETYSRPFQSRTPGTTGSEEAVSSGAVRGPAGSPGCSAGPAAPQLDDLLSVLAERRSFPGTLLLAARGSEGEVCSASSSPRVTVRSALALAVRQPGKQNRQRRRNVRGGAAGLALYQ